MDFSKLKDIRNEKKLSQSDVAKLVGVSLTSYQLWEREVTTPAPENLTKLIEVLGLREGE